MWKLIEEYKISTKIIDDLFDGVESDLKEKVQLNSKKWLPRPTFRSFINFKSITTYRGTYARKCN